MSQKPSFLVLIIHCIYFRLPLVTPTGLKLPGTSKHFKFRVHKYGRTFSQYILKCYRLKCWKSFADTAEHENFVLLSFYHSNQSKIPIHHSWLCLTWT